jgi:ubiquinone/menaquinone biosynthesis C-methylase UbiE
MGTPKSGGGAPRDRHAAEGARLLMKARSAGVHAAFFLPYLKAGTSLIDAGCGGGSITLGLAEAVAPGQVTGVDVAAAQIGSATAAAEAVANVLFREASVYELPFPDDSFDAAFSHAVLEHLSDPVRALRELRRVLKPGGILGVAAFAASGCLHAPADPVAQRRHEMVRRLVEHNGGNWNIGPEIKRLLRESGFVIEAVSASHESFATLEEVRLFAQALADVWRNLSPGSTAAQLLELGWADREELELFARNWLAWAEEPDAFTVRAWIHGVGRKALTEEATMPS